MSSVDTRSESHAEPRLLRTLHDDFGRIHADLKREGLGKRIRRTFQELEAFYLSSERRQRLAGMGLVRRWVYFGAWLVKSLFLRLTPVRRVMLVIGLLFMSMSVQISTTYVRISNVPGIGVGLVLLVLMLELKDKLLARDELEAGRTVQNALLPVAPPEVPGWDVCLFTRSANDVGGDLVDWQRLDERRVGVALGDVAGKGLPAALLMAKLQATLRALAPDSTGLADLAARVNRILCRDGLPNRFSTLVYLELEPHDSRVRLVTAGHMPPLVARAGSVEELPRGGTALGLLDSATYAEQSVNLGRNEALIVYSDGATEAMNGRGEMFGDDRLRAIVGRASGAPAAAISAAIRDGVDEFVGDAPPHDDLSLVIVRRR
jgi:serine phosphatase RsbU (regulator of sigma subunit)